MPTCATEENKSDKTPLSNLILPVPDTDFRDFLDEVEELAGFAAQIIEAIEKDPDAHAREKKKLRLEDRRFFEGRTAELPEPDIEEENILAAELNLAVGRPRMPAYAVYVFVMIRGVSRFVDHETGTAVSARVDELVRILQRRGLRMPAVTTILENVNLVSHRTRELIFDKQIGFILQEQWDDFGKLTIDGTSVKANSCWPTDGKIPTGLLMRANRLGQKLHIFGLEDFRKGWVGRWLQEMDKLEFQICLAAGKPKSKGKLKKHYRRLLKRGRKAADSLTGELSHLEEACRWIHCLPLAGSF